LTVAGLRTHGDWRHVATGCTVLVHIRDRSFTAPIYDTRSSLWRGDAVEGVRGAYRCTWASSREERRWRRTVCSSWDEAGDLWRQWRVLRAPRHTLSTRHSLNTQRGYWTTRGLPTRVLDKSRTG